MKEKKRVLIWEEMKYFLMIYSSNEIKRLKMRYQTKCPVSQICFPLFNLLFSLFFSCFSLSFLLSHSLSFSILPFFHWLLTCNQKEWLPGESNLNVICPHYKLTGFKFKFFWLFWIPGEREHKREREIGRANERVERESIKKEKGKES